jgi:isopenicillin N synthase-like dioxygenase
MRLYTPPREADYIPIVDLERTLAGDSAGRAEAGWKIHKACRETGFFYVKNHRVPKKLLTDQFHWAERFFDLPLSEKLTLHMDNSPSRAGYEPMGGQILDSQEADGEKGPPDLKESFYLGVELEENHPLASEEVRAFGHNQWPSGLPGFRDQMLAYQSALAALANHILSLIALSLDLRADYFEPLFDVPTKTVRLIKYPPQPDVAHFNQLGAGAHTDWGAITVLAQDDSGGLEIQNTAGDWISAPPVQGTFIVNLGDLMARWTNDLYRSTLHRVRNGNSRRSRYSVPFFYNPRRTAIIECLPTCLMAGESPKYTTVSTAEHIDEMFRRSYDQS